MGLVYDNITLEVQGTKLKLASVHNLSDKPPILFLHGFGSCKEDLADVVLHKQLQRRGYIAYDAPGCGHSDSSNLSVTDIPFLVETAEKILSHFQIDNFHLIGHSMGGLTGLLLAQRHPTRVLSFVNIKGNLAPEDCFLSRQIYDSPSDDPEAFLEAFIIRTRQTQGYGNALFASTLRTRVRPAVIRPIFESMVQLSDGGDLLDIFLRLPCPKLFMFGEQNKSLSYLPRLRREGVELAEIAQSGHFPMYSNPVAMYACIAKILQ